MALVDVWVIAMLCSLTAALTNTHRMRSAQLSSARFCSVQFSSCLLFARMTNGLIGREGERERVAAIKRVWLKNSYYYYYYPHSHTHRIQMRNENLMILFALLFASFRNLFILHSFVRPSVRLFVHLFVHFHSYPPFRASLCSRLFNEQTHDHY